MRYDSLSEMTTAHRRSRRRPIPPLLFVAANASFRDSATQAAIAKPRSSGWTRVMQGYADVLRKEPDYADAAYNYEFVSRMRDTLAKAPRDAARRKEETERTQQSVSIDLPAGPTFMAVRAVRPKGLSMSDFKTHHADALRRARRADGSGSRQGDPPQGVKRACRSGSTSRRSRSPSRYFCGCWSIPALLCLLWIWRLAERRTTSVAGARPDACRSASATRSSATCRSGSA